MSREFSEDVRIRVKDGLREFRSLIRQNRHDRAVPSLIPAPGDNGPFPFRQIEGLFGHAVSAFDDVMTIAERLAPRRGPLDRISFGPQPLQTYFRAKGDEQLDGERAFRRDLYRLAKLALEKETAFGFRIREIDFAAAHDALERCEAERIAQLGAVTGREERKRLVAAITASLFTHLVSRRPIQTASTQPAGNDDACNDAVLNALAAISIACGLATLDLEGATGYELMEIALLAVDARADRIRAAMNAEDTQTELTELFASLLTHLN